MKISVVAGLLTEPLHSDRGFPPQTARPSINPPQRMARSGDRPQQPFRKCDLKEHRPPPLAVQQFQR